ELRHLETRLVLEEEALALANLEKRVSIQVQLEAQSLRFREASPETKVAVVQEVLADMGMVARAPLQLSSATSTPPGQLRGTTGGEATTWGKAASSEPGGGFPSVASRPRCSGTARSVPARD